MNGQLVLWDISAYSETLKSSRTGDDGQTGEKQVKTPSVKYELVSSIEASHRGIIKDVHWLPKEFEVWCG